MISTHLFLEKYPYFRADKDGLTKLNGIALGEFVNEGYIIGDFFIPYSQHFKFSGTNNSTILNYELLGFLESLKYAQVSLRFDLEKIIPVEDYIQSDLGGAGRGIPEFKIEQLLSLKSNNLSEKIRRNSGFDIEMGNKIHRTEFYYQTSDKSLHIEEITENKVDIYYVTRFHHTIFQNKENISHTDGSLLYYTADENETRYNTSLDKKIKNAGIYVKLFRIDGLLKINDWIWLTYKWFISNELVEEWLDPNSYFEQYKHILIKNIDY